jgi:hypothetical protein
VPFHPPETPTSSTDFAPVRPATEEALVTSEQENWDNEGGHMSSTAGRVTRVSGADLPYAVVLTHHESEATEHSFATMREAEAFIRRNTPVPRRVLSALYDRPASDF